MKRFLIFALSLLTILSCAACFNHKQSLNTTDTSTAAEVIPGLPQFGNLAEQKQMAAISVPLITHNETANDGTVIFKHVYQDISLILPEPNVAEKIVIDFLNRTDAYSQNADTILQSAKDAYAGKSLTAPYLCQIVYEPKRIDYSVLSMQGEYILYSGSSHPETSYLSVNYDLTTGNVLTISDIITGPEEIDNLCNAVIESLNSRKDKLNLRQGFELTVKELFKNGSQNSDFWYLSANGLCLYFSPYEIAPYAAGVIEVEIPYAQLAGILEDAYFPPEQISYPTEICIVKFDEMILENFTQFAEITIESGVNKCLLYTNKPVYNIRLQAGEDAEKTVFAAYALTPGDAIVITTNNNLKLLVNYRSAEQSINHYITVENDLPVFLKP